MTRNFWGNLSDLEDIMNPLDVLKEQSGYLMDMTNNVIFCDINNRHPFLELDEPDTQFCTVFSIMSKMLDQYEFQLFTIFYDVGFFPMKIELDENLSDFLGAGQLTTINNEQEFINFLNSSLNNDYTKRIIKSLYALSK